MAGFLPTASEKGCVFATDVLKKTTSSIGKKISEGVRTRVELEKLAEVFGDMLTG
jgi:hypothetical protein